MNDFIILLILAYFKEYKTNYDIVDLSAKIGCSVNQTIDFLEKMICSQYLFYENNLLRLTLKGRTILYNSNMDFYSFECKDDNKIKSTPWPVDKVYCPHEFSKEKWRENQV